jgi:phosphate starvation-inducible PhoH-like protein
MKQLKNYPARKRFNSPRKITYSSQEYIEKLNNPRPVLVCTGPTGSGKTYLACKEAVQQLKENKYNKLIITRPSVGIENENHGFLPGKINTKMEPWMEPFYQNIVDIYGPKSLDLLFKQKRIEVVPLMYLRGRTFNDSFVIADEMQNSTIIQFKTVLTRIGTNTKMVLTGDLEQVDFYEKNGLEDFIERFRLYGLGPEYSELVELSESDIRRSDVIKEILNMYSIKRGFTCPW